MTIESTINLYAFYEDKDKARELFLDALMALQRHYGLYVASGCDCCGGVFLADGHNQENREEFLTPE